MEIVLCYPIEIKLGVTLITPEADSLARIAIPECFSSGSYEVYVAQGAQSAVIYDIIK